MLVELLKIVKKDQAHLVLHLPLVIKLFGIMDLIKKEDVLKNQKLKQERLFQF